MASGADHLLICTACGTQFDADDRGTLNSCRICDDPRQFVPPGGQSFTTLMEMTGHYSNKWQRNPDNDRIWSLWTEPKFGIGQRALLIRTDLGNVLWDLITYLDEETIDFVRTSQSPTWMR